MERRAAISIDTSIFALHLGRGSMMRLIGRLRMEASPVSVVSNFWDERMPEIRRVVVPLLPQSKTESRAVSPCSSRPWTRTVSPLIFGDRDSHFENRRSWREIVCALQEAVNFGQSVRKSAEHDAAVGDGLVSRNGQFAPERRCMGKFH